MTKYKLNNTLRSPSEVTLTAYMTDNTRNGHQPELDSNQNDNVTFESNRNIEAANKCHICPHSCEFLKQSDKIAASLVKQECDKFGLNELKVEGLEVCLCEKYNGGCKLCPRPSLTPTLAVNDGKESCHTCHRSTCSTVFPSKLWYFSNYSIHILPHGVICVVISRDGSYLNITECNPTGPHSLRGQSQEVRNFSQCNFLIVKVIGKYQINYLGKYMIHRCSWLLFISKLVLCTNTQNMCIDLDKTKICAQNK